MSFFAHILRDLKIIKFIIRIQLPAWCHIVVDFCLVRIEDLELVQLRDERVNGAGGEITPGIITQCIIHNFAFSVWQIMLWEVARTSAFNYYDNGKMMEGTWQ